MDFAPCRHGQLLSSPRLRRCSSPKLVGLKLVSPQQCAHCYCRDHEPLSQTNQAGPHLLPCAYLGERLASGDDSTAPHRCLHPQHHQTTLAECRSCADYLFPLITPTMPVEMVQQLIALPAKEQTSSWWRWENVREAHRRAATSSILTGSDCPARYRGRGIVIVGGGRYFVAAFVTIRVLRALGCQLPIELWHLDGEICRANEDQLQPYGVTCVNAEHYESDGSFRFLRGHWWRGWQLKSFALRNSSFREVLLLDSDCYPVQNPEFIFDWPKYRDWGAVFWPDLERNRALISSDVWQAFGVEPFAELPTESGQLLVHKGLCWRELNLAVHYNSQADYVYHLLYGDKDTFPMAWQRLGRRYARMWPTCQFESVAIRQFDHRGQLLFLHRVHDKFRVPETQFDGTPQLSPANEFHAQFPLEAFCFGVIAELAAPLPTTRPVPGSIQQMYPPVPVDRLTSDDWQGRFVTEFLEAGELDADPFTVTERTERPQTKCFSVSLFKQNVNNRHRQEFPVDEVRWETKYWRGLQQVVQELSQFPQWKLRIYVEPGLWERTCTEFGDHLQVELFRMAGASIGAQPGSLWRFLALADRSLELVLETDIDESLLSKLPGIKSFELDTSSAIGRIGAFRCDRQFLIAPQESPARNYATMLGSRVISRPSLVNLDLAAAMRGFMAERRVRSRSERPWAYADDDELTVYHEPIGGHPFGWGSHWFMYTFDERFLKHVLYYHFADQGRLHTWTESCSPAALQREGRLDLEYVRSHGNVTINPHRIARLESLQLSPEAFRIACRLDEFQWVFDSLLAIMRSRGETGYCGGLFFHDIDQPDQLELVPKRLNLFAAVQSANHALEVGFNAGHSSAVMLIANPTVRIIAIDNCSHAYTKPAVEFLNSVFGGRITLIEADSLSFDTAVLSDVFDFLHLDGDHSVAAVASDLQTFLPRCRDDAVIVLDDHEAGNEVARAAQARDDLIATDEFIRRAPFPGSSHAFLRYRPHGETCVVPSACGTTNGTQVATVSS